MITANGAAIAANPVEAAEQLRVAGDGSHAIYRAGSDQWLEEPPVANEHMYMLISVRGDLTLHH